MAVIEELSELLIVPVASFEVESFSLPVPIGSGVLDLAQQIQEATGIDLSSFRLLSGGNVLLMGQRYGDGSFDRGVVMVPYEDL
jgi:hypothetical protein